MINVNTFVTTTLMLLGGGASNAVAARNDNGGTVESDLASSAEHRRHLRTKHAQQKKMNKHERELQLQYDYQPPQLNPVYVTLCPAGETMMQLDIKLVASSQGATFRVEDLCNYGIVAQETLTQAKPTVTIQKCIPNNAEYQFLYTQLLDKNGWSTNNKDLVIQTESLSWNYVQVPNFTTHPFNSCPFLNAQLGAPDPRGRIPQKCEIDSSIYGPPPGWSAWMDNGVYKYEPWSNDPTIPSPTIPDGIKQGDPCFDGTPGSFWDGQFSCWFQNTPTLGVPNYFQPDVDYTTNKFVYNKMCNTI